MDGEYTSIHMGMMMVSCEIDLFLGISDDDDDNNYSQERWYFIKPHTPTHAYIVNR